jgi:uncharacterized protein (TIGR02145 family)
VLLDRKKCGQLVVLLTALAVTHSRSAAQGVTDADGNVYDSLAVGSQVWLKQNLRTTHYNNGDPIPHVTGNAAWAATRAPAYCWYNDDSTAYAPVYGALYNWYAVDPASNGHRDPCPPGWHVPSTAEWSALTTFLGGESVAGGKLKEAGTAHWSAPNTGATNESGFTGLPGGYRGYVDGSFKFVGTFAHWWSTTEGDSSLAWGRGLFYLDASMDNSTSVKRNGFCLRCVKGETAGVGEKASSSVLPRSYPNPFNGNTKIRFRRSSAGPSDLAIFDVAGRLVRTYRVSGPSAGEAVVEWDGRDEGGGRVPSGTYFCRSDEGDGAPVTRMVLLR